MACFGIRLNAGGAGGGDVRFPGHRRHASLLLIGATPNAIAYGPKQFSTSEFFKHGNPI